MKVEISPSLLASDFRKLGEEIRKAENLGVKRLHIDVMDGVFVPNISIGQVVVEWIRKDTKLFLDVHLMIEKPHRYFKSFKEAGADMISFHIEEYGRPYERYKYPRKIKEVNEDELKERIEEVKELGLKVCLAYNPPTSIIGKKVFPLLDEILLMTVNPGFGGQKFIPEVLPKINYLRSIFPKNIGVDGGINQETIPKVLSNGANVLVMGTSFFRNPNIEKLIKEVKKWT